MNILNKKSECENICEMTIKNGLLWKICYNDTYCISHYPGLFKVVRGFGSSVHDKIGMKWSHGKCQASLAMSETQNNF